MIKLSFSLRRRPELSREEFQRYWFDNHAPLVKKHAQALRIHRYVQLHTCRDDINVGLRASRNAPEEYDGVAELWWQSREDMTAALETAEGQAAGRELLEDERRFIDLEHSPLFIGEEKQILGP
jgi:uncharacterized protein (TIGR02118 family)